MGSKVREEPGREAEPVAASETAPACLGERCQRRIYERARPLLDSAEDAEEVAQEVCLRCLRERRRVRSHSWFPVWLHRAVRSACEEWRARNAPAEQPTAPNLLCELRRAEQVEHAQSRTDGGVTSKVRAALARLTARQRQVLEWRYFEGDSPRKIARRLGSTDQGARQALYRARGAFRRAYLRAAKEAASTGRETDHDYQASAGTV